MRPKVQAAQEDQVLVEKKPEARETPGDAQPDQNPERVIKPKEATQPALAQKQELTEPSPDDKPISVAGGGYDLSKTEEIAKNPVEKIPPKARTDPIKRADASPKPAASVDD